MSIESNATKMWSGRFRDPLNKTFEEWQRSFPFDWRLIHVEVRASIAQTRAPSPPPAFSTTMNSPAMVTGLEAEGADEATNLPTIVNAFPNAEDVLSMSPPTNIVFDI